MLKYIFASIILFSSSAVFAQSDEIVTFNANKACADLVGIPYASDNFSDEEWKKFKRCLNTMHYFDSKY